MNRYSDYERYWCPVLVSGSFVLLAAIVMAPLWR
jgi:hypothetical protein